MVKPEVSTYNMATGMGQYINKNITSQTCSHSLNPYTNEIKNNTQILTETVQDLTNTEIETASTSQELSNIEVETASTSQELSNTETETASISQELSNTEVETASTSQSHELTNIETQEVTDSANTPNMGNLFQHLTLLSRKMFLEEQISSLIDNPNNEDISQLMNELEVINIALSINDISITEEVPYYEDETEEEAEVEDTNISNENQLGAQNTLTPEMINSITQSLQHFNNLIIQHNLNNLNNLNNQIANGSEEINGANEDEDADEEYDEEDTDDYDDEQIEGNPLFNQLVDVPVPLPEEKLKELSATTYSSEMKYAKCCVCMDDFTESDMVRVLLCHHIYHQGCIDYWFTSHPNCPVCDMDQRETPVKN